LIPANRIPSHPGEILLYEFLEPLGMTAEAFALHIGVPPAEVDAVVRMEAPVTPRLAWLIGMATGTGPELWMNLQTGYDLARNRPERELKPLFAAS
jgi:addiction module HigA family antidote